MIPHLPGSHISSVLFSKLWEATRIKLKRIEPPHPGTVAALLGEVRSFETIQGWVTYKANQVIIYKPGAWY